MKMRINGYNDGFKVVSLAFDEETKKDLLEDKLDFLFVTEENVILYPLEKKYNLDLAQLNALKGKNNYDVYELWENGILAECYCDCSVDNYFFVTGKCNSNCIMCPSADSSRKKATQAHVDELIEIARHIPSYASHLTITGGEPFMASEDIFRFLDFLKQKFVQTEFLILTNGRIFAVNKYVSYMTETQPGDCIIGIPIHGSNANLHDSITRAVGSFAQTVVGIKNLCNAGIKVELRLVVSKINVADFGNIASFIIKELSGVQYVNVMAMEMTGNAYVNRERLWIPYVEAFKDIESALMDLLDHGIDVRLYNFPLCTVTRRFWPLCEKSISPGKVRFKKECDLCKYKAECGGVFAGTFSLEKNELEAIK